MPGCTVLILFLHLIVTVVRLAESVAPYASWKCRGFHNRKCSISLGEVESSSGGHEVIRTPNPLPK